MKMAFWQRLTVLTLLGFGASSLSFTAQAAQFEQQEVDQERFIVLAAPGGDIDKDGAIDYKLLILEQLKDQRPCWNETGSGPSNVDPLLLNFDFTGICNRLIDSNGFSVRTGGTDQALQYNLRVIREDNDLVLVAASTTDRDDLVEVGRTHGVPTGFSRIILDPGWRLTRRAFNGRAVGHIYLTYDQPMDSLLATSRYVIGVGRRPSAPAPMLPPSDSLTPGAIPPDATFPGSTMPLPPSGPNVIPVPSLPPAPLPATPALPPTTSGSPSPLGSSGSSQGSASPPPLRPASQPPSTTPPSTTPPSTTQSSFPPSLSTLIPPPPPVGSELPAESSTPSLGPATSASAQTAAGGSATPVPTPSQSSTSPSSRSSTRPPASSSAGSSITRTPSRVPTASNSGGALLRPQTRRSSTAASSTASTSPNQQSSRSPSTNSSINSSTNSTASSSTNSAARSEDNSTATTSSIAQAETYQVVVVADSAETQDKVRSLAPSAFLTTINGQVVMQVGVFRDRQAADQLQQRLSLEGLPTAVIPVR